MTSSVRVIPLGGLGEIGKNCTVVEDDDGMVLIDCGLTFPREEGFFGADVVLPDLSYVVSRNDKLRGLLLTHGHEDHIGAVVSLLSQCTVPMIAATRFTLALVKAKADEAGLISATQWVEIDPEKDPFQVGNFEVEAIRVSHSIPDCVALALHTEHGTIVHSGDIKLDPSPLDGQQTNLSQLAEIGADGVALYLGDSTNADIPGHVPSERSVSGPIRDIVSRADGRVIVTCFSSNIHRVQQLFDAATDSGRALCVLGRSLLRNVNIARNLGILDLGDAQLLKPNALADVAEDEVLVACTGSQGEPLSVLNRVAGASHPKLNIHPNDTVIFSSRMIPGNETRIFAMIDRMSRVGAQIHHAENSPGIHVSGHGAAEELQTVLQLVRPDYFMPVHGEWRHLRAHAELAHAVGVDPGRVIVGENGYVVELRNGRAELTGEEVPVGGHLVDRDSGSGIADAVMDERRRMSSDGLLVAVATFDRNGRPHIAIEPRGLSAINAQSLVSDAVGAATSALFELDGVDDDDLKRMTMRDAILGAVREHARIKPLIVPIIAGKRA